MKSIIVTNVIITFAYQVVDLIFYELTKELAYITKKKD